MYFVEKEGGWEGEGEKERDNGGVWSDHHNLKAAPTFRQLSKRAWVAIKEVCSFSQVVLFELVVTRWM